MIRVQNLVKRFGLVTAVDGISFGVGEGKIVGFLGPNGAGKSTTIRILTCFLPATRGAASIGGFDVFTQSMEVRKRIGYLPESAPLYPEMRVNEYLQFRGKLHGLSPAARETAMDRVVQRCWLGDFVRRPIGQLSKGMRQRVGLADALLHDPDVLILDEPTVGLDPTQIRESLSLIRELSGRHTILFSSHILPQVEQICDEVIIINRGRIVAQGAPRQLAAEKVAGSRLIAELQGPADEVAKAIGALAGVAGVDLETQDSWHRLAIRTHGKEDARESVFKLASERGWSLREIRREVGSLEDYYLRITSGQDNGQA
jgi:ABC-2 type transport system ATP-binding protein